jgi:hypothetical protein
VKAPLDRNAPQQDQPVRRRPALVRAVKKPDPDDLLVLPPPGSVGRMAPQVVSRLQAAAGNAAVSRLMVQRRQGPESDPKFRALTKDIRAKQKRLRAHPPAKSEAAKAQGAAKAPPDDKQARGKAAQAEKMNAAKPGEFDKAAFIKAVNAAIDKQAPKSLSEAKDFGSSGKAAAIKGEVSGRVTSGKQASAGPIDAATKAAPDTSKVEVKAVTPLAPDHPPGTPATPDPALAIPDKAPKEATDFSEGPKQVNNEMAEAGVTETQLAESNEPEFGGALEAKKEGEEHSATAPPKLRASEAQTLAATKAQAATSGTSAMGSMAATRKAVGTAVTGGKQGTKTTEETKRAQVAAILQKVFDATKKDVEGILKGLDKKVDDAFNSGEKAARNAFTAEHKQKMEEYKDRRYSGLRGKYRWVRDKFKGLPSEANQIFVNARAGYVSRMQQVIASVAEVISVELGRAKARIAQGRNELKAEVDKLPKDLKALGKKAAGEFGEKFDQLTESVDSKGNELVQTLATKYKNALTKVDEEIEEEKEKNSGLIARAINAVKAVIKTILELKDLLFNVLAKAAEAIGSIIAHPIRFLGNLVSAVGAGLEGFMSRIGEHLKKGLVSWLLGTAGSMGIEIPKKFDLSGILTMIAGMLGLTWEAIKARVISRGIPGKVIEMAEGSLPIIGKLRSDGIGALGEMIVAKVGDLKELLFTKIGEYLIPEVLKAGVMFIISMLNPASAFIKACKMIIDIVIFIFTRGKQIIEFINAVLDALIAIAKGGTGGVPAMIENALAKSIPVLIGVLAAILGVGGIADKVKKFIQSLSKPVMKAVDWVTDKIVSVGKGIWGRMKAVGTKIKEKAKATARNIKDRITGKPREGDSKQPDAGKAGADRVAAERPRVQVPFDMAGHGHTLTFDPAPAGGVNVTMASVELPLTTQFKHAYANIEFAKRYLASIADADIRAKFEAELAPLIATFQAPTVAEFKAIYDSFYPKGTVPTKLAGADQKRATENVRPLLTSAEKLLEQIRAWAAKAGLSGFEPEAFKATLAARGKPLWDAELAAVQARVRAVLAGFNYKGAPMEIRGSVATGQRSPAKGSTLFTGVDFDVDMYVINKAEFKMLKLIGANSGDLVFADPGRTPDLYKLQNQLRMALDKEFPSVKRIKGSSIVLREEPKR